MAREKRHNYLTLLDILIQKYTHVDGVVFLVYSLGVSSRRKVGLMALNSEGIEPELAAMHSVLRTLQELSDPEAQHRVIDWVAVKLGLNLAPKKVSPSRPEVTAEVASTEHGTPLREGTINTVVTKLGANSCRTLLIASAGYLSLFRGKEKFSRDELIAVAKDARLWRQDYVPQLSLNITRMCEAEELVEKAKDVYDIAPKKLAEIEKKLAE